jgi:hypothetical protein
LGRQCLERNSHLATMLNLFYQEPDPDRWIPFDRYPRAILRRCVRGRPRPGGQMRVFLNLCAGLDRLGVKYRVNDYRHARGHPEQLACIVGKPHVLDLAEWRNPIVFGAAVHSHPLDDPNLLQRLPVKRILVPGEWMRKMCEPFYGDRVSAWPVGIDTELWKPALAMAKDVDVLIYDKILWEHDRYHSELLTPIVEDVRRRGLRIAAIRYGSYREDDYRLLVQRAKSMVFLCQHETQGIAYQQALSCGVPVLAWDRRGMWQDPAYYPNRVRFGPVSSVPYWSDDCGMTFTDAHSFTEHFETFWRRVEQSWFSPRRFIVDNLTLEHCARQYLNILRREQESC